MAVSYRLFNLGPLTTVFTPASTCSHNYVRVYQTTLFAGRWAASCTTSGNSMTVVDDTRCYPGYTITPIGATNNATPGKAVKLGIYSPGSSCPYGFTTACTLSRDYDTGRPEQLGDSKEGSRTFWSLMKPGETAIACCPPGYECANDGGMPPTLCQSTPTSGEVVTAVHFDQHCKTSQKVYSFTEWTAGTLYAYRLNLLHRPPREAVSMATATAVSSASSTSISNTSSPRTEEATAGLSSGAKIAIGLVVPVVLFVIATVVLFVFWRRWSPGREDACEDISATGDKPELEGDLGVTSHGERYQKAELHSDDRVLELQSNDRVLDHSPSRREAKFRVIFSFLRRWWCFQDEETCNEALKAEGKPELEGDPGVAFGEEAYHKPELDANRGTGVYPGDRALEIHSDNRAFDINPVNRRLGLAASSSKEPNDRSRKSRYK